MKLKHEKIKIISIAILPPGFLYSGQIIGLGSDGILYSPSKRNDSTWHIWNQNDY